MIWNIIEGKICVLLGINTNCMDKGGNDIHLFEMTSLLEKVF